MIELYSYFHNYDKNIMPSTFQIRNRVSRKHNFQLVENTPSDGVRGLQLNSFYYRAVKTWNDLPKVIVNASDINNFKNILDEAWKESPIKYTFKRFVETFIFAW